MRRVYLFLWCLAFSGLAKAQSYLHASAGPSVPIGDFGRGDIQNNNSGFAMTGEYVVITYTHLLTKSIGVTVTIYGQRNPVDKKALSEQFGQVGVFQPVYTFGGGSPPPPPPTNPQTMSNWQFTTSAWKLAGILLGGEHQLVLPGKKFFLVSGLAAGVVYSQSPKLSGTASNDSSTAGYRLTNTTAFGFQYQAKTGLRYQLSQRVYLAATIFYSGTSHLRFHNVTASTYYSKYSNGLSGGFNAAASMTADSYQTIASVQLGLGVYLAL